MSGPDKKSLISEFGLFCLGKYGNTFYVQNTSLFNSYRHKKNTKTQKKYIFDQFSQIIQSKITFSPTDHKCSEFFVETPTPTSLMAMIASKQFSMAKLTNRQTSDTTEQRVK